MKNREHAMAVLRAKLYEIQLAEQQEEIYSRRKSQVGTGSRSEKIKTYNYKVAFDIGRYSRFLIRAVKRGGGGGGGGGE